jgi:hypothetical protein
VCSSLLQEANNTDIARSGQVIYRQGNERGEKKKKKERNKHFSWHSGGIGTGVVDHQITKNVLHGERLGA